MIEPLVGTAGWTLPRDLRPLFEGDGTQLERYARRFPCVEINSSFYRPHRASTYERWARSVPERFRFALKVPRTVTHMQRLADADDLLARFFDESAALGEKRGVILVQLPPSLAYEESAAHAFFAAFRARYTGHVACEPRHASWFGERADGMLRTFGVARVAADPPPVEAASTPGGSYVMRYLRLHGSPIIYRSAYDAARLEAIARELHDANGPIWCIFDNTTFGAATHNALSVLETLHARVCVSENRHDKRGILTEKSIDGGPRKGN